MRSTEALYTPAKVTDDDDDEEISGSRTTLAGYLDREPYKDDIGGDGDDGDGYGIEDEADESDLTFSPVHLDDEDDDNEDDDANKDDDNEDDDDKSEDGDVDPERARVRAKKALGQKMSSEVDLKEHDESDDRVFVGGGWGRHGSQVSSPWLGRCSKCAWYPCTAFARVSSNPDGGPMRRACFLATGFVLLVLGSGMVGYWAGLPADDDFERQHQGLGESDAVVKIHEHTMGEEWLEEGEEILEHPKEFVYPHMRDWQEKHLHGKHKHGDPTGGSSSGIDDKEYWGEFDPNMSSADLLHLSESVFQVCSERSLRTKSGWSNCIEKCRGHMCCFESDVARGGCANVHAAGCFAYAACENALKDFHLSNVNTDRGSKNLKANDVDVLVETCSKENIATLSGVRDCGVLCQKNLCCFERNPVDNCMVAHPSECEAYSACRALTDSDTGDFLGFDHKFLLFDKSAVVAKVQIACDPSSSMTWVEGCRKLCADHLCCFSARGTRSSCREKPDSEEVCQAYQGCDILTHPISLPDSAAIGAPGSDKTKKLTPDVSNVIRYCSNLGWQNQCRTACHSRRCCFNKKKEESCFSLNKKWCLEFSLCEPHMP